jgi:H/ACA ribonucleoprotein complex subunit 2
VCAASAAKVLKRGVKEVVKALRKNEKGLCVLAGDISPIDVISHIPGICEEGGIPYVYVNSKADLGAAAGTKRPTSVVLVAPKKGAEFEPEKMKEVLEEIAELSPK